MIEFEPRDGVRFVKNVMVGMEDGVRVTLDMHVPDDGSQDWKTQSYPLLLEHIPYRKDDSLPYSGYHHRFAQNGIIGMVGASYGGFTAVQVAVLAPPHLATSIPIYFTNDRYTDDCHYRGGAMRCYYAPLPATMGRVVPTRTIVASGPEAYRLSVRPSVRRKQRGPPGRQLPDAVAPPAESRRSILSSCAH